MKHSWYTDTKVLLTRSLTYCVLWLADALRCRWTRSIGPQTNRGAKAADCDVQPCQLLVGHAAVWLFSPNPDLERAVLRINIWLGASR